VMKHVCRQQGFSLIELVISIVVFSIAAGVLVSFFSSFSRNSVGPMIQEQGVAIAEAYMEEISLRSFNDAGNDTVLGPEAGETRATFDTVNDFHGLNDTTGAAGPNGNIIAGLTRFNVAVAITPEVLSTLVLTDAYRIDVTVTHDAFPVFNNPAFNIVLSSYRTNY